MKWGEIGVSHFISIWNLALQNQPIRSQTEIWDFGPLKSANHILAFHYRSLALPINVIFPTAIPTVSARTQTAHHLVVNSKVWCSTKWAFWNLQILPLNILVQIYCAVLISICHSHHSFKSSFSSQNAALLCEVVWSGMVIVLIIIVVWDVFVNKLWG